MNTPVRASDQDLRALAAIVSQDRPDLPDEEGLPPSLMADLKDQIRCDGISLERFDSELRASRFLQGIPALGDDGLEAYEDLNGATWPLYWDCQPCSYPDTQATPAQHNKDLGLLLNPAVACQRHVQRYLPAAGARA